MFDAYQCLAGSGADAVLMLGTGMATLDPILRGRQQNLIPAVSCNLALVWETVNRLTQGEQEKNSIHEWIKGSHWKARLDLLFDPAVGS